MADAKKVTVEITYSRVVIPQSVHDVESGRYVSRVASLGDVIEVHEDVAEKLEKDFRASRVTKDSPATINKTLEAAAEAERKRRANLLTGDQGGDAGDGKPNESWRNDEIQKYAEKNKIDLKGATTKAEMLKAIQEAA